MATYQSFLHFYIYLKTENRECIRPNIHKTRILPKVGKYDLIAQPGFTRVLWGGFTRAGNMVPTLLQTIWTQIRSDKA